MSDDYFFDSYAIIELIKGNPNYESFKDYIIITGVMNLAEVFYSLLLEFKENKAIQIINKLNLKFIGANSEIAIKSAKFRYKNKSLSLSYIDCTGYILAKENNLKFLTGDRGFINMENVEFVSK